ncbi:cupin domain-containing protein [Pseudanabaena sp. PCC 6802]|uniref:cupin domain-containing protein n=1 Tax=Pseudanabaena sp. PCC 6802 TaxID=118173 RepID=UPI00034B6FAB|nr:cupin domain-containing protein [Pseudanabaena sp. PCC 6802]
MNIFDLPPIAPPQELYETLVSSHDILIERIISKGHTTPVGEWYDQEQDEWVLLLQGEAVLAYADGSLSIVKKGDFVFIPARTQHRVEFTSTEPPCIWLAVHGKMQNDPVDAVNLELEDSADRAVTEESS